MKIRTQLEKKKGKSQNLPYVKKNRAYGFLLWTVKTITMGVKKGTVK